MGLLKREDLLKKDALKIERVDLGEDEYVYVREMTAREKEQFESSLFKTVTKPDGSIDVTRNLVDFRAKLAVNTICDKDGNLLLKPEDYEALSKSMKASKLEKIVTAAQKLNAIAGTEKEMIAKNS